MQAIADRNGGVDPRYLPTLQRLFQNEAQLERRLVLMTVLKQSPLGTLKEVVRGQKIVLELQKWLQSAVESKEIRLAFRVTETLDRLPVDLSVLQVSLFLSCFLLTLWIWQQIYHAVGCAFRDEVYGFPAAVES